MSRKCEMIVNACSTSTIHSREIFVNITTMTDFKILTTNATSSNNNNNNANKWT